MLRKRRNYLAS